MVKDLFILNKDSFNLLYPPEIQEEINELAEVYALLLTIERLKENYLVLSEAEVIFSDWGLSTR